MMTTSPSKLSKFSHEKQPSTAAMMTSEALMEFVSYLSRRKEHLDAYYNQYFNTVQSEMSHLNCRLTTSYEAVQSLFSTLSAKFPSYNAEQVESVDRVLKVMMSHLDIATLKSCRLVSVRWNQFAIQEFQNRKPAHVKINLSGKSSESIHELIILMQNTEISETFPTYSFSISSSEVALPYIQSFFTSVGSQIKKLFLGPPSEDNVRRKMSLSSTTSSSYISPAIRMRSMINDLSKLLTIQAPNIESLKLDIVFPGYCKAGIIEWDSNQSKKFFSPGLLNRNELLNQALNLNQNQSLLPKLKQFVVSNFLSIKIFEEIMSEAVNLTAFNSDSRDARFNSAVLNYFTMSSGKQRVHLLKKVDIVATEETIQSLDRLLKVHPRNLNLKTIQFLGYQPFHRLPDEMWPTAMKVINRIFRLSAGTLEQLIMRHIGFLNGLQIPIMPKLKRLILKAYSKELVNYPPDGRYYYFPNTQFLQNFPRIEIITIENEVSRLEFNDCLRRLLKISSCNPKESVKFVCFKGRGDEECVISDETWRDLVLLFPNACLSGV